MIDLDDLPKEGTYPVKDINNLPMIPRDTDDVLTIGYVNFEDNEFIQVLTLSPNDYSCYYAILVREYINGKLSPNRECRFYQSID